MHQKTLYLLYFLLMAISAFGQDNSRFLYIERFKDISISEASRTGIPASIKLAQGILESNAGLSTLALRANNHFGIKCHNDWTGKKYYHEDDDYDDQGKLIESCFRVYKNAEASYIAHSEFLRDPNKRFRYGFLFSLPPHDYRAWAHGLKSAGYATSPTYAEKLIRVIETYELFRFDQMTMVDLQHDDAILMGGAFISLINDVKVTFAKLDDTPSKIADRTGVSVKRILKYNEKLTEGGQTIKPETRVYLQRKRGNFRGKKKWHYVKETESMFDISQLYGLRLIKLYRKNRLEEGTEAAADERVKLRGCRVNKKNTPKTGAPREEIPETPVVVELPPSNVDDEEFGDFEIEIPVTPPGNSGADKPIIDTPPATPDTTTTNPQPETDPVENGVMYTVQKGDTLFSISRLFGISVEAIKSQNNLNSDLISPGQRLKIF